jgi:tetratricopeptide (TPR) repeat protein
MTERTPATLIGRNETLAELHQFLSSPTSKEIALLLLNGEEGIGKSVLLHAAVRDARELGFVVLEGRPQALDLPQPFSLLHELLSSPPTKKEPKSAPREAAIGLAALGFVPPGRREKGSLPMGLLPVIASFESPKVREEKLLAALSQSKGSREEEKQELFDRLADHFEESAAGKMLLLAVDDLHYADQASVDFLMYLGRRTRGRSVKIVATCCPEPKVPDSLRSALDTIEHEELLHRIEIKRLTDNESMEFLASISRGREIPTATVSEWLTASRGNPLALVQLFQRGMSTVDFSKKVSVQATAILTKLSEADRRILSHAAILGKSFQFNSLYQAVGGDEEELVEKVDALVSSGILKDLGDELYEFSNEELWRETYDSMSDSRKRILHRKAAEVYEKLHPKPSPNIIPEIGRHFYLGKVHDKSLLYNRYAATLAMNAFSPDVAIHYLERAREDLAALPGDHRLEEADVLKEIGEQYGAIGDDARADEFFGDSIGKLVEGEDTLRALLLILRAHTANELDKLSLARQYSEEAIQLLEKVGHKKGLARAHLSLGRAAYTEGHFDIAKREMEQTLGLLDPEKDAKEVALCYINLGNLHAGVDDPDERLAGIEYFRKAIRTFESMHDFKGLAKAHNNLAIAIGPSHPREALDELMKAQKCAEKGKDRRFLGWILFNSVELHLALGEEKEATQNNEEARRILSRFHDEAGMQQVALNDGMLAQRRRSYAESERAYLESLKLAEALNYPQVTAEVLVRLATMYSDWGRKDEVAKTVSRIRELGEEKLDPIVKTVYDNLKKQVGR